jgi:nonsense-mediated mRNA decay protein 3
MALCLKRMGPLPSGTKLVDAGWIWTEPHSKRLKLKLKVQADVLTGFRLEQGLIVEFVVHNKQCTDCAHKYTDNTWQTVVQVRQKVAHKRTMLTLEQVFLFFYLNLSSTLTAAESYAPAPQFAIYCLDIL